MLKPIKIRNLTLKNRVIFPPMTTGYEARGMMTEKSIKFYYSNFENTFSYKGYFFSYKLLPKDKSDARPTFYTSNKNILSLFSPKIANIFSAEEIVNKFLNDRR